jgi:hypothetical protein
MLGVCACFVNALVPPKSGVTLHKTHTNGREGGGGGGTPIFDKTHTKIGSFWFAIWII